MSVKKIYYNKLIRDNIPAKMKKHGTAFETKKLDKNKYEKALLAKVEEEAGGVRRAKTKKELISEIADILVVIEEILKSQKIKPSDFCSAKKENIKKKGGFSKRLWLVWSADDGYKTNEKRTNKKRN